MDTKLTLKLNETVIKRAKKYAAEKKLSLSGLIENYLDSLTREEEEELEISPFVKSIATGKSVPLGAEEEKDRADYLDDKYK